MDFGCESYALLKEDINDNQRAMWQVEVGPCGDTPPSNNITFTNKFLYEVTQFYRISGITFTVKLLYK
jgi:hypothetical protein